jgi:hypothetical protein
MTEQPVPLTSLSEDQRAQAHSRFPIIRPALEDGVTQAKGEHVSALSLPAPSGGGSNGLVKRAWLDEAVTRVRSDKGKSRRFPGFGHQRRPRPARASQRHPSDRRSPNPSLRAVYEAVWGLHLDGANFRRGVVTESGWAIPTGHRARPGARSQTREGRESHESSCLRQVRAAGRSATRRSRAARTQGGRGPRQDPRHSGHPGGLRDS